MKISVKNLGILKQAEYELGELTIICGENNTGKTYVAYSLYGFYDFWKNGYLIKIPDKEINKLMDTGTITLPILYDQKNIDIMLSHACKQYSKFLPRIFAAQSRYFDKSSFSLSLSKNEISVADEYSRRWGTPKNDMIQVLKEHNKDEISVNLLADTKDIDSAATRLNIINALGISLKEIIFGNTFSDVFIASAERTGAVIFKNELNIEKNLLLKEVAGSSDLNPAELLSKIYSSSYALPVRKNIDFIRKLEDTAKDESFISKKYPDLLDDFADIIGGDYRVGREGLYYIPKGVRGVKLTMGEGSSSVRSLLDIGFYLRYIAKKGDMLMIDEPELNLHPNNQRRVAKLFAAIINLGIKVFITTHSDYIIKELNTLIMLNYKKDSEIIKHIMDKYKYKNNELISCSQVKVFISDKDKVQLDGNTRKTAVLTLIQAETDPQYGIEAESFDKTILEMNSIQESIILGRK